MCWVAAGFRVYGPVRDRGRLAMGALCKLFFFSGLNLDGFGVASLRCGVSHKCHNYGDRDLVKGSGFKAVGVRLMWKLMFRVVRLVLTNFVPTLGLQNRLN